MTDEELVALRKEQFSFDNDSVVSEKQVHLYIQFLCRAPNENFEHWSDFRNFLDRLEQHCKENEFYNSRKRCVDTHLWMSIYGLLEIINDYPDFTPHNFDFANFRHLSDDFEDTVKLILEKIQDDNKRLEFAKFFLKHFMLLRPRHFFDNMGKKNTLRINHFKTELQFTIEQIEEKIKHHKLAKQNQKPRKIHEEPTATLDEMLQFYVEHGDSLISFLTMNTIMNKDWFNHSVQTKISNAQKLRQSQVNIGKIVAGDDVQNKYEK